MKWKTVLRFLMGTSLFVGVLLTIAGAVVLILVLFLTIGYLLV